MSSRNKKKLKVSDLVRGPNSKTSTNAADVHKIVTKERAHEAAPGDYTTCACCGQKFLNVYQHQNNACEHSAHYVWLQDKTREAHLHLLQRHHDHPEHWKHPGPFVMLKANMIRQLAARLSWAVCVNQDERWNILMHIKRDLGMSMNSGKTKTSRGDITEDYYEIAADHGLLDGLGTGNMWVLVQRDKDALDPNKVATNWDVKHDVNESKLVWRNHEQETMEKIRAEVVARHPESEENKKFVPHFCCAADMTDKAKALIKAKQDAVPEPEEGEEAPKPITAFNGDFEWAHLKRV